MSGEDAGRLVPAGFFALRTPLLPFEDLLAWSEGGEAAGCEAPVADAGALSRDRARLRERLRAAYARPELRAALFVATPGLADVLDVWMRDPANEQARTAEPALTRYFSRAAGRATPFGLWAGCSVGTVGERTRLVLEGCEHYRRHSRLDMEYVAALAEALARDSVLRNVLRHRPNSSLYRAAGRLRYVEGRVKEGLRSYHLVGVDADAALEGTLARAREGATAAELAEALVDEEISIEEAATYIDELIESQILVPDLGPTVTGHEPIDGLVTDLTALPEARSLVESLEQVKLRLAAIDAGDLRAAPDAYRSLARSLEAMPAKVEQQRLIQVDMVKPARATLGPAVLSEITRGIELLHRLARPRDDDLSRFVERFLARYEQREVPLVEALDEESGIGFGSAAGGGEPAPLLRDLAFPARQTGPVPWGPWEDDLARKLAEAVRAGAMEISLEPSDLEARAQSTGPRRPPLPDALSAMAVVVAASDQALDRGEFRVVLGGAAGPSGAQLLGRFCHGDPHLARHVADHLRSEEALDSDAVYAEIVHLPEGRLGNILLRPVLRDYELTFLGRSGAPAERQLSIDDLRVSVVGNEVVLHSARLGRRVVPRLTSAHNYSSRSLPLYRFLCSLQGQRRASLLGWDWGALGGMPFLPRVRVGRLVLSIARWRVYPDERKRFQTIDPAHRFYEVQRWREERQLPRWVVVASGDHRLPVDLSNVLSIDAAWPLLTSSSDAADLPDLEELYPGPDELCASGPEGRFVHEIVVPFVKTGAPPLAGSDVSSRARCASDGCVAAIRRTFPPGSEWLTAKLYAGPATVDRLLRDVVRPLVKALVGAGAVDRWFFVRYGDPDHHLRLRFHGSVEAQHRDVLPAVQRLFAMLLGDGRIWRVQLDTYEREVERYAGPEAMEVAERIFHADSDAVLEILEALDDGDAGEEERWRLALCGAHQLLCDLGLDLPTRLALVERLRQGYAEEHRADVRLKRQLGERYRTLRRDVSALLDGVDGADQPIAPALAILGRRSERLAPLSRELEALRHRGCASVGLEVVAESVVHMHLNRILRSAQRAQELVLYDFLARHYSSSAARGRR